VPLRVGSGQARTSLQWKRTWKPANSRHGLGQSPGQRGKKLLPSLGYLPPTASKWAAVAPHPISPHVPPAVQPVERPQISHLPAGLSLSHPATNFGGQVESCYSPPGPRIPVSRHRPLQGAQVWLPPTLPAFNPRPRNSTPPGDRAPLAHRAKDTEFVICGSRCSAR